MTLKRTATFWVLCLLAAATVSAQARQTPVTLSHELLWSFLRVGAHDPATLTITLEAATRYEVSERGIPTGTSPVAGTSADLRGGPRLGDLDLDTPYRDVQPGADGVRRTRLSAPDGTATELWQDEAFPYLQVFTPRNFPHRSAACQITAPFVALTVLHSAAMFGTEPTSTVASGQAEAIFDITPFAEEVKPATEVMSYVWQRSFPPMRSVT